MLLLLLFYYNCYYHSQGHDSEGEGHGTPPETEAEDAESRNVQLVVSGAVQTVHRQQGVCAGCGESQWKRW